MGHMEREELSGWLRLLATPGVGNGTARQLLAQFGLPWQVFDQDTPTLASCVGPAVAQALRSEPAEWPELLERTLHWLHEAPGLHHVLTLGDSAYPPSLLDMEDPPLLLYAMGRLSLGATDSDQGHGSIPERARCLAMVGSRNPTPQGAANARQFAVALAGAGMTVVSGLALGIDGASHEGALEGAAPGQLATIAVVGTGLDRVYPKQHRVLAHRIFQQGLLISEYPLGTPPLAANFPRRNRIIAGLCSGTLVVEAALQSGSLITARLALEQGREVFAIPGSIHATQARGCHALIKQGAKLVESAQDVLEELLPQGSVTGMARSQAGRSAASAGHPNRTAPVDAVLDAMGYDPVSLDALQARTGMDTPRLQARLMELELALQVGRLPGGLFQRIVLA